MKPRRNLAALGAVCLFVLGALGSGITPIARMMRKSHKDDSVNYEATTKQL
jgi:hypothetical protein